MKTKIITLLIITQLLTFSSNVYSKEKDKSGGIGWGTVAGAAALGYKKTAVAGGLHLLAKAHANAMIEFEERLQEEWITGKALPLLIDRNQNTMVRASEAEHKWTMENDITRLMYLSRHGVSGDYRQGITKRGSLDEVRRLLESGLYTNLKNGINGYTALMEASKFGHSEIVQLLLAAGADINIKVNEETAASLAASNKHYGCLVQLIEHLGVDVIPDFSLNNRAKYNLLKEAAKYGCLNTIEALITEIDNPNFEDEQGNTLLMLASSGGHTAVVRKLIDLGTNVNLKNKNGYSVLIEAVKHSHLEIAIMLLNAHADIHAMTNDGQMVVSIAIDACNALCNSVRPYTELYYYHNGAHLYANIEPKIRSSLAILECLINAGADGIDGYAQMKERAKVAYLNAFKGYIEELADHSFRGVNPIRTLLDKMASTRSLSDLTSDIETNLPDCIALRIQKFITLITETHTEEFKKNALELLFLIDAIKGEYSQLERAIVEGDFNSIMELASSYSKYNGKCTPDNERALVLANITDAKVYEYLCAVWEVPSDTSDMQRYLLDWLCALDPSYLNSRTYDMLYRYYDVNSL